MAAVLNSFIGQRRQGLLGNTIIAQTWLDPADLIELAGAAYWISRQIVFEIPDAIRDRASVEFKHGWQEDGIARTVMHAEFARKWMRQRMDCSQAFLKSDGAHHG